MTHHPTHYLSDTSDPGGLPMPDPDVPDVWPAWRTSPGAPQERPEARVAGQAANTQDIIRKLTEQWEAAQKAYFAGAPETKYETYTNEFGESVVYETAASKQAYAAWARVQEDGRLAAETLSDQYGINVWTGALPQEAGLNEELTLKLEAAEKAAKLKADALLASEELEARTKIELAGLTNAISRGDLSIREADRKFRSIVEAAGVESELLRAFAGRSLPAGTEFFPGFEPGGAFGTVYGELEGGAFPGLRTGGTFEVNPGALAAQIRAAGIAETALPGVDLAQQTAMAELARLGLGASPLTGAGQSAALGGDRQTATAARLVDIPLTPTQTQVRLTNPTTKAGVS
jgi:hypothetical protein